MDSPDDTGAPLPPTGRERPQTPGYLAAVSAATETILNCYLREGGEWRPVPAESGHAAAEGAPKHD